MYQGTRMLTAQGYFALIDWGYEQQDDLTAGGNESRIAWNAGCCWSERFWNWTVTSSPEARDSGASAKQNQAIELQVRDDVIQLLKDKLARLEGRTTLTDHASKVTTSNPVLEGKKEAMEVGMPNIRETNTPQRLVVPGRWHYSHYQDLVVRGLTMVVLNSGSKGHVVMLSWRIEQIEKSYYSWNYICVGKQSNCIYEVLPFEE